MSREASKLRTDAAKELLLRRQMRTHLTPFIGKTFETVSPGDIYQPNWHIELIAEHLEAVRSNDIHNLIINIPPRFLKSISVTVAFPAWLLGLNPSEQIMAASHAKNLSIGHSVDTRLVMESDWYLQTFPDTIISKDQNEKAKFATTMRGHRISTSAGASCIGMGGNYLILDDIDSNEVSTSDIVREATNNWVAQEFSTRANNPKKAHTIVVQQRLHPRDTTGTLGEKYRDDPAWTTLILPQKAPAKKTYTFPITGREVTREKGDFIHTDRWGEKEDNAARKALGGTGYAAKHGQRPTPEGGGRIELGWFPRYFTVPLPNEVSEVIISFDTAQKPNEINDPSVGMVFVRKIGDEGPTEKWYLVDVWLDRVTYPVLKRKIISMWEHYNADSVLIEDKSSGSSLIQDLTEETTILTHGIVPIGSKAMRADEQTPQMQAGKILLPEEELGYSWMPYLLECLETFPTPPEWDQIDALSQFLKFRKQEVVGLPTSLGSITKKSSWRHM